MKNPINMWKFPIKKQLELRREMKKNFKSKKLSRVLLNKFVERVA